MKTIRTKIYDLIDKNEQEIKDQIKSLEGVYNAAFVDQEKYLKKHQIKIILTKLKQFLDLKMI